jgi:hypothetical protein
MGKFIQSPQEKRLSFLPRIWRQTFLSRDRCSTNWATQTRQCMTFLDSLANTLIDQMIGYIGWMDCRTPTGQLSRTSGSGCPVTSCPAPIRWKTTCPPSTKSPTVCWNTSLTWSTTMYVSLVFFHLRKKKNSLHLVGCLDIPSCLVQVCALTKFLINVEQCCVVPYRYQQFKHTMRAVHDNVAGPGMQCQYLFTDIIL